MRLPFPCVCVSIALLSPMLRAHDGHSHGPSVTEPTALRGLRARVAAQPEDVMAWSRLGGMELEQGRRHSNHAALERAEQAFGEVLRLLPESSNARLGLAYARLGQHDFEGALRLARDACERTPGSADSRALLGDLHLALGNYVEAELCFDALQRQGLTYEALTRQALIAQARGRTNEANACLEDALEAAELLERDDASRSWCLTLLGDNAREAGDPAKARSFYQRAVDRDPEAHTARWRLLDQATSELLTAPCPAPNPADAFAPLDQELVHLIASHPLPAYRLTRARLLRGTDREEQADRLVDHLEAELTEGLAEGDLGHLRDLVETLLLRGRGPDLERAEELARLEQAEVRHDIESHALLARVLSQRGKWDEARAALASAMAPGARGKTLLGLAAEIDAHAPSVTAPVRRP